MPKPHFKQLYPQNMGLFLDLYHLTMAYGFWKSGMYNKRSVFHLFYRKNPFQHPYAIAGGLELALEILDHFRFDYEDIAYLARINGNNGRPMFDEGFLNYLQRMELDLNISAIPEGTVVFPHEPLMRVEGPLLQAQIVESALLNVVNFSTLIATKAARTVQASNGESILEFGLRRAQGLDGAVTASRAAYIGGCHATSNVMAGRMYDIPVKGTHAHSWVQSFDDELTSFYEYAKAMPNNCIFLVDTYDTLEGVKKAIEVGRWLRDQGHEMNGIRLDSGDLAALSIQARKLLDEAGFPKAAIVGSDGLDENKIRELKEAGSTINVWGVGTNLVTAKGHPALGGVYKLAAIENEAGEWDYKIKLSETAVKTSNPGVQSVRRFWDKNGLPLADQIYDPLIGRDLTTDFFQKGSILAEGEIVSKQDLLVPVMEKGKIVYSTPSIHEVRQFALEQQQLFDPYLKKAYPVGLETNLSQFKGELMKQFA
jgi:nicotinate phosphoribosyltransferase